MSLYQKFTTKSVGEITLKISSNFGKVTGTQRNLFSGHGGHVHKQYNKNEI